MCACGIVDVGGLHDARRDMQPLEPLVSASGLCATGKNVVR